MNFNALESSILNPVKGAVDISTRAVSTAVIGTAATYYLVPGSSSAIRLFDMEVPAWVIYGAIYGLSGATNQSVKMFMEKNTPKTAFLYQYSPVTTGITSSVAFYLISILSGGSYVPSMRQLAYPFMIGALADYSGMLITNNVIDPVLSVNKAMNLTKSMLPDPHIIDLDPRNLLNPVNLNHTLSPQIMF